jgi:hypothetical protein
VNNHHPSNALAKQLPKVDIGSRQRGPIDPAAGTSRLAAVRLGRYEMESFMRNILLAAVAALALAATPSFAATTVDASSFNTAGPGVSNDIQPGLAFAARHYTARIDQPRAATESVDQADFNTAGPGAANSLNSRGVPASGFGEPANMATRKPGDAQSVIATEATSAPLYNTSGPGETNSLNPGLTTAGHAR